MQYVGEEMLFDFLSELLCKFECAGAVLFAADNDELLTSLLSLNHIPNSKKTSVYLAVLLS